MARPPSAARSRRRAPWLSTPTSPPRCSRRFPVRSRGCWCPVGAPVKAGEPLASVASPDFAAAVSAYRKAEAAARNTRRIADLDQELFKNDGIARRDLEQAETDAVAAEADRDAALAAAPRPGARRRRARGHPAGAAGLRRRRRHPIAHRRHGRREADHARPAAAGRRDALLHGGRPVHGLGDGQHLRVESSLRAPWATPAEITTGASPEAFPGTVDYIAALVDPNTRAISVRIVARNPKRLLKRDLYVSVAIHSKRDSSGLLVPVSAVLRDDENLPFVYVQNADGALRAAPSDARRAGAASATRSAMASSRRAAWWRTAGCSCSSPRANERRRPAASRRRAAHGLDHQPHRRVVAAPAVPRRPDGAGPGRGGRLVLRAPAGGRLSGSLAAAWSRWSRSGRARPPRKWSG